MLLRQIPIPLPTSPLKGEEHSDSPPLQGEGKGAAVQSRHNDAKVGTGTMAPDGGGGVNQMSFQLWTD